VLVDTTMVGQEIFEDCEGSSNRAVGINVLLNVLDRAGEAKAVA
jgi:hypothetical protein